ncbi:MAG: hypothetical protein JNL60_10795 [Bacteroidia bacterium]|nr:hypothetical protein [Bacteroidia bacterium]
MRKFCWFLYLAAFFLWGTIKAQHIYYKNPDAKTIRVFKDSAKRILNLDTGNLLAKQFNYVLKFYPEMRVKNIIVEFKPSSKTVHTKPKFGAIFKLPEQRVYKITLSRGTKTTLDSILIDNLSFNSQLGLIANQVSIIEDLSTGGFFNFISWYVKHLTHKGSKKILTEAEQKTLEVGLGYQLLSYNRECEEKLKIDNWTSTKGYTNYMRHYRNRAMKPQLIVNLMNDMPVYVSKTYK